MVMKSVFEKGDKLRPISVTCFVVCCLLFISTFAISFNSGSYELDREDQFTAGGNTGEGSEPMNANGTNPSIQLDHGWNLVSFPYIVPDTRVENVLGSIDGKYDSVQYYDSSDANDPWKHYHVSKPSYLNDLSDLDNTMGFWVHVTDPSGAELVVDGDEPAGLTETPLYPGWNLVSYASHVSEIRAALNINGTICEDTDVIQTYDPSTQNMEDIGLPDYLDFGKGYWIHVDSESTWSIQFRPDPSPSETTLITVGDAYVREDRLVDNYGDSLKLDLDGDPMRISYLMFDLSTVSDIESAVLRLHVIDTSTGVKYFREVVDDSWSEDTVTFDNRPAVGNEVASLSDEELGWVEIDITPYAQANQGSFLSIEIDTPSTSSCEFSSKESAYPPELVLNGVTTPPPSNNPPVADAGNDQTVIVNQTVHIDGSGSHDSDGSIVDYSWDFGDGNFGSGMNPDHVFTDLGVYTVTLTVTDDDDDTHQDSCMITVDQNPPPGNHEILPGFGSFTYYDDGDNANRPVEVYYYRPDTVLKVVFTMHGSGRNAISARDRIVPYADQYNALLVSPEFSKQYYPDADDYNRGFVKDGGGTGDLRPRSDWAFLTIEEIFDIVLEEIPSAPSTYSIQGNSGAGQFISRFAWLIPEARLDVAAGSNSGWYTLPDRNEPYPDGIADIDITDAEIENALARKVVTTIGELDTDPNSYQLKHNEWTDAQGNNRYERALFYQDYMQEYAANKGYAFNWDLRVVENVGHPAELMAHATAGAVFAGATEPPEMILPPTDDTYIDESNPDSVFGSVTELSVDGGNYEIPYIKFDLSSVTAPVDVAILKLYITSGAVGPHNVYKVADNSWTESTLTWNNAPAYGEEIGMTSGGEADGILYIEITDFINENIGGEASLAIQTEDTDTMRFRSSEATDFPAQLDLFGSS
jgi:hypothetical protein